MDAVTPGLTLVTLYSSGVGTNKTKQHTGVTSSVPKKMQTQKKKFTVIAANVVRSKV